jgi:hypothetical protein
MSAMEWALPCRKLSRKGVLLRREWFIMCAIQ